MDGAVEKESAEVLGAAESADAFCLFENGVVFLEVECRGEAGNSGSEDGGFGVCGKISAEDAPLGGDGGEGGVAEDSGVGRAIGGGGSWFASISFGHSEELPMLWL